MPLIAFAIGVFFARQRNLVEEIDRRLHLTPKMCQNIERITYFTHPQFDQSNSLTSPLLSRSLRVGG